MLNKVFRFRSTGVLAALALLPALASAEVFSDYEAPGTRNAYHTDPNVNSRRTDHFLMRFGPKPQQGFMVEQMYQGQMQFLEHVYDTWMSLGLHPLGGTDPNTKYKLIIEPAQTWDGDTPGTAVSFGEKIPGTSYWVPGIHIPCNSLGYKAPNGTTPHESGHNWQNEGGLPPTKPQGLTESLANWVMQLHLGAYPKDWPVVGMPMGHAVVGYNCMSLFNYFMEAPGYGSNFINQLVFAPNLNSGSDYLSDDIIRKAIRVDTSGAVDKAGAIHDGLGLMNAKMLGMDFWNHRVNTDYAYDQDLNWQAFMFNRIPLVRQPGVSGTWYRPEWTCVPQALMNSYIPLSVTDTNSPRTVTCDFRPVADAVRGTSFRACFVAFNQNKEPRYGRLWNGGVNSFKLADDEKAVYLAIIACPRTLNAASGYCDYTLDNVAMFPYRLSLTGANPRGWQWPAPASGFSRHPNGGGIIANTASVASTAYVGSNAMVLGSAKVYGNARIEDYAVVDSTAIIGRSGQPDNPVISGHAYVTGSAQVYGHAKVRDYGWVWGTAKVYDNALVMAHSLINGASVFGDAVINQAPLRDTGLCFKGTFSGSAIVGGDCSGLGVTTCSQGVWCEYPAISVADNKYQYLGYNFEKKSCVFAMDQYGMNHSYLIGEPQVVRDTVNGLATSVLRLNGTNQYVELRPEAVDFANLTLSAWVKWTGSGPDQRIFSTGDGNQKSMYLTPQDGTTGKLRWVISDGNTNQALNGTAALTSNVWTHLAVALASNTATLYVNGSAVDTQSSLTLAPDQLHAPLLADWNFIGRGNAGNYFAGRVDEFRVYNKALSAAEVTALLTDIATGSAPAADTAAPTPSTATWLVNPVVAGDNAITMSATEGTDAGGNGVLYYFRCLTDSTHDSGWLSENKYTDCNCAAATTYTYAVQMKDKLGNTGAESSPLSATTPAADATAPTPNPPTFAAGPVGVSSNAITMTATKGVDSDETVLYKFTRLGTSFTSGWTSSRNWTDTNLISGASYTYTLQVKYSHGNLTSVTTSAATVSRDDTAPALDADPRLQWDTYPYTQLDKTVRMYARELAETAVDYYYECVENPSINSGWLTSKMWVTPPLADGTYSFHYKLRDRSPRANQTGWSVARSAQVLPTNAYHDYSLPQLAGLPDSYLVRFSGVVTQVTPTNYLVCSTDGQTNITVVPTTFGYRTDATLLNQNVTVKGHLWTYTGNPKWVTGAIVAGSPQIGKIEFENCDYDDDLARLQFDRNASGSEYLGWYQPGWSVTVSNVAATTQLTLAYAGGGGTLSLYTNNVHYKNLTIPGTASGSTWSATTITGLSIPTGTTLRFQQDAGDAAPNLDYLVVGPAYVLSGKVTDTNGVAIAGATVYISAGTNADLYPLFSTLTDASGNYSKTLPNGIWYVAAGAKTQAYVTSEDRTVTINGANVANVNFALQRLNRNFPRMSDLLFACIPEMLPDADVANSWPAYAPTNFTFGAGGAPTVEFLNQKKWEMNSYDTADNFRSATYSSPVAINGATIVVAVKPTRNTTSQPWYSVVSAFFDRLSVGVANDTGRLLVKRNGAFQYADPYSIPDGQITVLSLVVQPTGEYKLYANGSNVLSVTSTSDMTSLVPNVPGTYANTFSIGNNGPDGWSTFNGDIGDVCFYKIALTDAERQQLEANIASTYGIQTYAITVSAGAGGTISPNGATVSAGTSRTFTITPNSGYSIADVAVDGISQGPLGSYTFANVLANHTLAASFAALPPRTITASAGPNGSITPGGAVAVPYSTNQTFTITPNAGYAVASVVVDGTSVGALTSYTFNNVTNDHTITASFQVYTGPVPVASYAFESNVLDAQGVFNGTAYNSPTYVAGKLGAYAIQFNGSSQYVTIRRPVSNDWTIAFWVKTTQAGPTGSQWWNGNGLVDGEVGGSTTDFGISSLGNKVAFGVGNPDTTLQSVSSINSGAWTHVACTRSSSSGQMKVYINGSLEATATGPTGTRSAPATLHLGNLQTGANYFNGALDQLKIFGAVLSASDISALASEVNTYTITASAGTNGSITPNGTVLVNAGTNQSFAIVPNPNYGISNVVVDGLAQGPLASYTFTNVLANHSLAATFVQLPPPTVAMAPGSSGQLDITWPDSYGGQLLWSPTLGPGAVWTPVGGSPAHNGNLYKLSVTPGTNTAFYGLSR